MRTFVVDSLKSGGCERNASAASIERAVQRPISIESACRQLLEQSIPNTRCLFHGGRKSDKSTVIDRQAIVEEPSLDR